MIEQIASILVLLSLWGCLYFLWVLADKKIGGFIFFHLLAVAPILIFRPAILAFDFDVAIPEFIQTPDYKYNLNRALLWLNLWYILVCIGFTQFKSSVIFYPILPKTEVFLNRSLLRNTAIGASLISALFAILVFSSAGSFVQAIIRIRHEHSLFFGFEFLGKIPYYSAYLVAAYICYLQHHFFKNNDHGCAPYRNVFLLIPCMVGVALTGDRSGLVFPIALIFLHRLSLMPVRKAIAYGVISLVFLLSFISATYYLRTAALQGGDFKKTTSNHVSLARTLTNGLNANNFDTMFLVFRDYGKNSQLKFGESFLLGVVSVIPRKLWEGKPKDLSLGLEVRKRYIPNSKSGWPVHASGQWLANFGFIGVIFGGLLSGLLFRAIQDIYSDKANPISFCLGFIISIQVATTGFIAQFPFVWFQWLLPLLLANLIIKTLNQYTIKFNLRADNSLI